LKSVASVREVARALIEKRIKHGLKSIKRLGEEAFFGCGFHALDLLRSENRTNKIAFLLTFFT
jgi:hypothetical protein